MRIYTSCAHCGGELLVERVGQSLHPDCPVPATTPVHGWVQQLLDTELMFSLDDVQVAELVDRIDSYERRPPRYGAAALAYAAWGWPVFPCAPGAKVPLIPRDRGGHGLHDATTDPEQIQAWWRRSPTANVAVATGVHFDVLDVDPAGLRWWARVRGEEPGGEGFDIHGLVVTPRGGLHAYVPASGDGNLAGFAPGVDYRGRGGYVLLPPSTIDAATLVAARPRPGPPRYHWSSTPSPSLIHTPVAEGSDG